MGFFDLFNPHGAEKWELEKEFMRERHEQKLDLERRKVEARISVEEKKAELERARLDYQLRDEQEKLKEDFEPIIDEESEEDSPMMKMLAPIAAKLLNNNAQPPTPTSSESLNPVETLKTQAVSFSDEEIDIIYKELPDAYKKIAKTLPDEEIRKFIKRRYPTITEECLIRASARTKR